MTFEIELKAHVEDVGTLKMILAEKAEYTCAFEKQDVYWFPVKLRLRREKLISPLGNEKKRCLLTWKKKEVIDGIEINEEREFEIQCGPDQTLEQFDEILYHLGLKPGASKQKQGWAFIQNENQSNSGQIFAELVEVKGLGWFLELEIIARDKNEETILKGKERLLAFLDDLGIKREAIESRFYSEMLECRK